MSEHAETVLSAHTATSPEVNASVTELSSTTMPRMEVKNLNFYYSKEAEPALKSINMPIYNNRVTALIGPSGCGKSTLLRTMNRIYDYAKMGLQTPQDVPLHVARAHQELIKDGFKGDYIRHSEYCPSCDRKRRPKAACTPA